MLECCDFGKDTPTRMKAILSESHVFVHSVSCCWHTGREEDTHTSPEIPHCIPHAFVSCFWSWSSLFALMALASSGHLNSGLTVLADGFTGLWKQSDTLVVFRFTCPVAKACLSWHLEIEWQTGETYTSHLRCTVHNHRFNQEYAIRLKFTSWMTQKCL